MKKNIIVIVLGLILYSLSFILPTLLGTITMLLSGFIIFLSILFIGIELKRTKGNISIVLIILSSFFLSVFVLLFIMNLIIFLN